MDIKEMSRMVGMRTLRAVGISAPEAAWVLLRSNMSECSRNVEYVPTLWPQERQRIRKNKKQMDDEELAGDSVDMWKVEIIRRYENRPQDALADVSLAQFVSSYYMRHDGTYAKRDRTKVIRYRNYDIDNVKEYKREMVTLHYPFQNETVDTLDRDRYLQIYDSNEERILQARKEFKRDVDIAETMLYCHMLCDEHEEENKRSKEHEHFVVSKMDMKEHDAFYSEDFGNDIKMAIMEKISSMVQKRDNVETAEYCKVKVMRRTNAEQREFILEFILQKFHDDG
jgi:hypothetical protein